MKAVAVRKGLIQQKTPGLGHFGLAGMDFSKPISRGLPLLDESVPAIEITAGKTNGEAGAGDAAKTTAPVADRVETDNKLKADPTHPAPVQGSDSGRAQGETAGETETPEKTEVEVAAMFKKDDYVRVWDQQSQVGTIEDVSRDTQNKVQYLFHKDPRLTDGLDDFYVHDPDIQLCERPSSAEIERLNRLARGGN